MLDAKHVLHIPLTRFDGGKLVSIDIGGILENLIVRLEESGFDGVYVSEVSGHYQKRKFDELLITVFASDDSVEEIFRQWFFENNDVLGQEAFAYEKGDELVIEKLI